MGALETFDTALLVWMNEIHDPAMTAGMQMVTWLGSLVVLLPLAAAVGWHVGRGRNWRYRIFLPTAVLGAAGLAYVMKWLISRDRPDLFPSLIPMPEDASLPSAHSMQIAAFAAAWLLLYTGRWRHAGVVIACVLMVTVVGVSRAYLQVHFPSDILLGIFGGLAWAWLLHRLPIWQQK